MIFGWRLYGKVDEVPGLFYVATRFLHVSWFPVYPIESYLVVVPGNGAARAIALGLRLRSILLAYTRALSISLGVFCVIAGVNSMRPASPNRWVETETRDPARSVIILGAVLILLYLVTARFRRASAEEARKLAAIALLPESQVMAALSGNNAANVTMDA